MPPMAPCRRSRSGRHDLAAILPEADDADVTLFCCRCGAARRLPGSGPLPGPAPDDMTPEQIRRLVRGGSR